MQPEWGNASPAQSAARSSAVPSGALARNDLTLDSVAATPCVAGSAHQRGPRRSRLARNLKVVLVVADVVTTACALAISTLVLLTIEGVDHVPPSLLRTAAVSLPIWPVLFAHQGLYHARHVARRLDEIRRIVNSVLIGLLILAGISIVFGDPLSRGWLLTLGVTLTLLLIGERELARRAIFRFRARGLMRRRVVIVGRNEEAVDVAASLAEHPEFGYEVVGFADDLTAGPIIDLRDGAELGPYLGPPSDILDVVRSSGATGVIIATTGIDQANANRLIRDLTREGLFAELTSSMRDISSTRISVRPLGPFPILCVEPVAQLGWRRAAKRTFDIVAATLLVVALSPILLVAMAAIRITSGKGVLFSQLRVGKDGTPFRLYKLRTMVHDAEQQLDDLQAHNEASGPMFKMADDPRVTPVGRYLRAVSIDELPQLFNVIAGTMSLVGPRPALPAEAEQWDDALRERLRVQPGITGMWQVSGRYTTSLETYARLDLYYVDNWSMVTDLAILARTVVVVLSRHGGA